MKLHAVFSSPKTYNVVTAGGQPLGTLSQAFIDALVDGVSTFLLGGRAWAASQVQHKDRRILAETEPRGRQPAWGGFLPQFLGFEICQRMLATLLEDHAYAYLDDSARTVLTGHREGLRTVVRSRQGGLEIGDGEIQWWTFAGGRINATLRYALEALGAYWKIVPDNFLLRITGENLDRRMFLEAHARLLEPQLWYAAE